jgi:hypothetical protein
MKPNLRKLDTLPAPISREELHELAVAFAVEFHGRKGEVPPTWVMAIGKQIAWLETAWESEFEKDGSVFVAREMMKHTGAHAYSQIVEAWVAAVPSDRPDLAETLPSDRDPSERDDVLLVMTFDRQGGFQGTRFLVTVRRRGPNLLGPRDDQSFEGMDPLQGRMANLLQTRR